MNEKFFLFLNDESCHKHFHMRNVSQKKNSIGSYRFIQLLHFLELAKSAAKNSATIPPRDQHQSAVSFHRKREIFLT